MTNEEQEKLAGKILQVDTAARIEELTMLKETFSFMNEKGIALAVIWDNPEIPYINQEDVLAEIEHRIFELKKGAK